MLALTISLLLTLSACGGAGSAARFEAWRTNFLESPEHSITAEVTSTSGDAHGEFTLSYRKDSEGESVSVLSPALIADVKALVEDDGVSLSFEGVILETGAGVSQKLSPLTALPIFMDFLEEGYVKDSWTEREGGRELAVTELELSDASRLTLWQDKADMSVLYAAIRSGDSVEIRIKPTSVS